MKKSNLFFFFRSKIIFYTSLKTFLYNLSSFMYLMEIPGGVSGKESASQYRTQKCVFYPWVGKLPCSRKWHPTPVFLPGKHHGQRSLVGYSSWRRKELDMAESAEHVS